MVKQTDIWGDCSTLLTKYHCQVWFAFGSTLFAAIIAGLTWFVVEYRNQQLAIQAAELAGMTTQKALDAHTQQERENTQDVLQTLGDLQEGMQGVQNQLWMLTYRMDNAPVAIMPRFAPAPDPALPALAAEAP